MNTKNQSNRVTSVFGILVLLASAVPAAAVPSAQYVVIRKNGIIGLGFRNDERARSLTLFIQADPDINAWLAGDTYCTDNTGETLWRLLSKETPGPGTDRWRLHTWRGYGALSRNFRDQSGTVENHAAIIEGKLWKAGGGAGGAGGATPQFSLRISDIDADVDSLGRHVDYAEPLPVWPPTDVDHPLNQLEDECEYGEGGGLAMPITYPHGNLPGDNDTANFTGKAIRIRFNAKYPVWFYPQTIPSPKCALYKNGAGGTQTRVAESMWLAADNYDKTYYIHTCNGFTSVAVVPQIYNLPSNAGTPGMMRGYDAIRVYLIDDDWKLFVNTPETTDDYVPVEACSRVPITVTVHPSDGCPVWVTLKDSTNNIKFYDAPTGGPPEDEMSFVMKGGVSSETFWVSAQEVPSGDGPTIELYEGENQRAAVAVEVVDAMLKEATFSGESDKFHAIEILRDTDDYDPPHWQDNNQDRDADDGGDRWIPVAFSANSRMKISAKLAFQCTVAPTFVMVRAENVSDGHTFYDPLGLIEGETLTTDIMLSTQVLDNKVDFWGKEDIPGHSDEKYFQLKWSLSFDDGVTWVSLGTSKHTIYVTLKKPACPKLYEPLLKFSCIWAEGKSSPESVLAATWAKMEDWDQNGKLDSTGYKYYGVAEPAGGSTVEGLLKEGDAQCGAWTKFFRDLNNAHGGPATGLWHAIMEAKKSVEKNPWGGFYVKNLTFVGEPAFSGDTYEYRADQLGPQDGLKGQGMDTPARKKFIYHAVVHYTWQQGETIYNTIYDPSYGKKYTAALLGDALKLWEEASIFGFYTNYVPDPKPRVRPNTAAAETIWQPGP